MGGNASKPTKEKKIHTSNFEQQLPQRHDQLQNPSNNRPIELSWLQQNSSNDKYNRIHHHIHYDEHLHRIPLAINRWPKDNNQIKQQKSKSFIEEYIHQ